MAAKVLFLILALTFISGSQSAPIIETDSKVQFDPCTLQWPYWRPLYCYLPPRSPSPSPPTVRPPPASPVVRPPPASPVVRPSPPATSHGNAPATCAPASSDLIQNCGVYFYISRAAHDDCCQRVNAMSDACLANDVVFNLIERELLSIAKRICAYQPPRFGSNAATETTLKASP